MFTQQEPSTTEYHFQLLGNDEMVVGTIGFLGFPSTLVGPNFFADDQEMRFRKRDEVNAVGVDLFDPIFGPSFLNVEIFAAEGSLGTAAVITGTTVGTFWGVVASNEITRIVFSDPPTATVAQLFDNTLYGECDDPF